MEVYWTQWAGGGPALPEDSLTVLLMTQLDPKALGVILECVFKKNHINQKNPFILLFNINYQTSCLVDTVQFLKILFD